MVAQKSGEAAFYRVPGIVLADGPAGPRARVAGTGIEVFEVIRSYHATDDDVARLREAYHWLTPQQLRAALAYYHLYSGEIDNWLAEEDALDLSELQAQIATRYGSSATR